jgi:SP family facilitated glucose transporter-like MFS transporter 8
VTYLHVQPKFPLLPLQAREEFHDLTARLRPRGRHRERSLLSQQTLIQTAREFLKPRFLKPFFIIHSFNFLQPFCGLGIFTYYTVDILSRTKKVGSHLMDDYSSTVIVSGVRVAAVLISSLLMLRVGRRTLTMISGVFSSASALCLGTILCLYNVESDSLISAEFQVNITFALILLYAGSMSFGFFTLPTIMIGETQPSHVRGFVCGYIYTVNDLLLGGVVKMYPWMSNNLEIHGIFLFFGISCVICTLFVYLFLPETQGLTLQQIENYFQQRNVMWITRNKYSNERTENQEIDTDTL